MPRSKTPVRAGANAEPDICLVLSPENMERLRHAPARCNPCRRMTPQRIAGGGDF